MVDLRNAKEALENYLDGYERENDKVKLKIIHTYGVVECSRKIAEGRKRNLRRQFLRSSISD